MKVELISCLILLFACKSPEGKQKLETQGSSQMIESVDTVEISDTIWEDKNKQQVPTTLFQYAEFKPKSIEDFELEGYYIDHAFKLDSLYILSAYADGDIDTAEYPTNWGDRLVVYCNESVKYESQPVGDVYLYEPHFYQSKMNDSVIIICQLGFEYFFGGDVFLINKGKVEYIGNLDLEGSDPEVGLTEIIKINESSEGIVFTFKSDMLRISPGSGDDIAIKNDTVYFIHNGQSFTAYGL